MRITMKLNLFKTGLIGLFTLFFSVGELQGQNSASDNFSFIESQKNFPRIHDILFKVEDTLMKQFMEKKLSWPAPFIYLRSFKYDSQLEVWVKYSTEESYQLFKTYKVCALSGSLGPKRMEGDYQVPEGFYRINEFNPKSQFHLSLGLNYPNASDKILSDSLQPGGEIYIHGSCVTTGCIPITNTQIEELYVLAAHAKEMGQDYIPVHIFPIQYKNLKSFEYLSKFQKDFPEFEPLHQGMKKAYYHFDKYKKLPLILVNKKGNYLVETDIDIKEIDANRERDIALAKKPPVEKLPRFQKTFKEGELVNIVDQLPEFPGGNQFFQSFLMQLTQKVQPSLMEGQEKTFVMIEYVIDEDGSPVNAKVLRGGNSLLNERIESAFEQMPKWKPATRQQKNVAVKMKQTLFIEKAKP